MAKTVKDVMVKPKMTKVKTSYMGQRTPGKDFMMERGVRPAPSVGARRK